MRDFRLPRAVDLVLAEFASLNNLAERRDLPRVLAAVARALADGGWFCRRQHRAIVARRLRADVLGRRLEIQARATWKCGGRRATRSARLRVARPGRTSLAARARDAVARLLDRRGNQASLRKAGFDFVRRFDGFDVRPKMPGVGRGTDAYYLARKTKAGQT